MKRHSIILGMVLAVIVGVLNVPAAVPADIEWTIGEKLNLKTTPLDICSSADGAWLYILSAGEVAVYSFAAEKIVNRIPLDKGFDRMIYLKEKNALVVTSHTGNQLQIIQLEVVNVFDASGLPLRGSKRAPVTMVVFSDYQ